MAGPGHCAHLHAVLLAPVFGAANLLLIADLAEAPDDDCRCHSPVIGLPGPGHLRRSSLGPWTYR
jgi:hypothetical protein